ncbi:MAG TPA: S24 family peptidase [Thermoanaerobaculia bacterium]
MSLGDRIREAIDASGEKDFVIADAARISTTTLSNIVRGVTQDPSISVVAAIADALGESVDALLQRPGHPLLKHERQTLTNAAHILLERVVPAPSEQKVTAHRVAPRSRKRVESVVLSDVAASPNRQIFTDVHEIRRFPIPRDLRARGVRRVFRVDGDSMTGAGIQHGDILFVRTNVTLEQANNQIVVCRHGDDEMVKRLRVNADRTVTLQSANDKYKPQTLTAEQARDLQVYGIVHSRITAVPSAG